MIGLTHDHSTSRRPRCPGLLILGILLLGACTDQKPETAAGDEVYWRYQIKGDFDQTLSNLRSGLEAGQFLINDEENLSKGLESNKHMLGGDAKWNTIGFERVTALHFCSITFNHQVFNIDMDWSVLCPFKVVAYTMKSDPGMVKLVMVRPTYILKGSVRKEAGEVGGNIEKRITDAIITGVNLEIPKAR